MTNCYHENIVFQDPAFGELHGEEAKSMWRMLIERGGGKIKIGYKNIQADRTKGSAEWEAIYIFSKTGRTVHNKIKASFEFEDGRIIKHTDRFNLWKWSTMALGPVGFFLGFTPIIKNRIRKESRKLLAQYMQRQKP